MNEFSHLVRLRVLDRPSPLGKFSGLAEGSNDISHSRAKVDKSISSSSPQLYGLSAFGFKD